MLTREQADTIIRAAVLAPSGSNSQPWRFVVSGDAIEFHYLPERDHPFLNHEEGGTLIALGAALANAELAARALSLAPSISYRPDGPCVAVMRLTAGTEPTDTERALADAISKRHSNRKPYASELLEAQFKSDAQREANKTADGLKLAFVEDRTAMADISHALTAMEEIALTTESLHKLFFEEILWSQADNDAGKQGLYLKTLEIPGPGQVMFKLLRNWGFARFAARLGIPAQAAATNAKQNARASAFGAFGLAGVTSRAAYLDIGRAFERLWLDAVVRGLSIQVVTGITFLARAMEEPKLAPSFATKAHERARSALATLRERFGMDPILVFRIGKGPAPTEISRRHEVEIAYA